MLPACAQGFSLLELLIGMALLAVIASSVGGVMFGATLSVEVADDVTRTTAAANARIEWLASLQFDADELAAGGSLTSSVDGFSEDPLATDADLYVRWQIVDESSFMKRIDVIAGIRGTANGSPRESRLGTLRILME